MSQGRKKPVSRKVVALQEELRRKRGIRDLQKRFLIVCEDGKSAPEYFKALKKRENLSAASIEIFGSDGRTQPIQVVQAAIQRKKAAEAAISSTEPFDQVWCVIDGDYGIAINNARSSAVANDIKLAITTKCFEYWILLHFEEAATPTEDCDGVVRTLKESHCPTYSKGSCDYIDIVPQARIAAERAKRLRNAAILPENQNPCSDIYLLMDAIVNAAAPSVRAAMAPKVENVVKPKAKGSPS